MWHCLRMQDPSTIEHHEPPSGGEYAVTQKKAKKARKKTPALYSKPDKQELKAEGHRVSVGFYYMYLSIMACTRSVFMTRVETFIKC